MLVRQTTLPAYNVQTAVDAGHALIVAHAVVLDAADSRCLQPMAEAVKRALEVDSFQVVADAGYSNGEQSRKNGIMKQQFVEVLGSGMIGGRVFSQQTCEIEESVDFY